MEVTICIYAVSEEELKREAGEFDLEAIAFLDLSDRGDSVMEAAQCMADELSARGPIFPLTDTTRPLPQYFTTVNALSYLPHTVNIPCVLT